MQDTKLFETILGITTPWHVARVELKTDRRRLRALLEFVKAEHPYEVPYIAWGEGLQVTAAYRAWASRETGPARTRPRPAATRRGTRGTRRRT